MAAHQRQRAVGRDPVAGTQLAHHLRRRRLSARASADQLIAAGSHSPATGIQCAERDALRIGRTIERMRACSGRRRCFAGLGSLLQILTEWVHGALVRRVRDAAEQRIAGGEPLVQPSPGGVREGAGAVRIDSVALGKVLHVKLGHPLHRPADLIGDGAQQIFKIAHTYMLTGRRARGRALRLGEDDNRRQRRKHSAANGEERDRSRGKRCRLAASDSPLDGAMAEQSDDQQGARQ
jgi:hypothetical protein